MSFQIIDHGSWVPYQPAEKVDPQGRPIFGDASFCRRVGDGADWYAYLQGEGAFLPDSVKATCLPLDGVFVTKALSSDASLLFPQNSRLIEVVSWTPDEVLGFSSELIYEPGSPYLTPYVPRRPQVTAKGDIWRRSTDAEAELIAAVLASLPAKRRELFRDVQFLDHNDPDFAALRAGFAQALGDERAAVILAVS